jgi:hypothetical protein
MSLIFTIYTLYDGLPCVEAFLRHPRCAQRSKSRAVIQFGRSTEREENLSTFKTSSTIIGAPTSASSPYPVSRDQQWARSDLIDAQRSLSLESIAALWNYDSLQTPPFVSLCGCLSQPTGSLCVGGISALVAPSTRGIVEGILATDE